MRKKKPFECDGLTAYPQMPGLVLLPENEEETVKIIKICEKHKIPIVFRGAGTGLSGGAIPHKSGVLLVMSKLNKIIEVDPNNRIAKVQPGVRNISISKSANKFGLYYALTHQVRLHVQLVEILQKIQVEYIASNTD